MSNEIFLPTLPHWQFGNSWSGSAGRLRFLITVSDGEGGKELRTELWSRDVCRELAQVEETRSFSCTQAGLDELHAWLGQRSAKANMQA